MTLDPLTTAPATIQIHAFAAMIAFGSGLAQFWLPKGTTRHHLVGTLWVMLMAVTAAISFAIHTINQWNGFSLIHLLSVFTLIMLVVGVAAARRGDIARHKRVMTLTFLGALLIAGGFTFAPGRIMHAVAFGGPASYRQ